MPRRFVATGRILRASFLCLGAASFFACEESSGDAGGGNGGAASSGSMSTSTQGATGSSQTATGSSSDTGSGPGATSSSGNSGSAGTGGGGGSGGAGGGPPVLANISITTSDNTSCAIEPTQNLPKCWGYNAQGQLGIGNLTQKGGLPGQMGDALPYVNLGALHTATAISAKAQHACALLENGAIQCWGYNNSGQLGIGNTNTMGDSFGEIGNLGNVDLGPGKTALAVGVGHRFTCALLDDHTVKCWGEAAFGKIGTNQNHGAGPNQMGANLPIVDLGTGRTALAISVGYSHACAILDDESVKCWGRNDRGQLGLGDTDDRGLGPLGDALPAVDLDGHHVKAISAGYNHTCAILDDGSLRCWGANDTGALGLEDHATRGEAPGDMGALLPPVKLGTGRSAVAISAGGNFTCAILDDATLKCWGTNLQGALGRGDTLEVGGTFQSMGDDLAPIDLGAGSLAPIAVSTANQQHACVAFEDHSVKCWGENGNGELGLGDGITRGDDPNEMGAALPFVKLVGP